MKKYLGLFLLLILFCVSASAQKITKPTLTPSEPTASQTALIQEGIKLHDAGSYDEAIAKYAQVLKENPDCTEALYEMSLSYYKKKDYAKFTDIAAQGIKYKSNELPQFYEMIGNLLDDLGKPQDAIQVYKDALKILEDKKEYQRGLSSIYYNLGVTYTRQKQYKEAREALKKAVENNFVYPSPNYLLALIFNGTGYKIPALLAAARLISLEVETPRAKDAVKIFLDVAKAGATKEANGDMTINLNLGAPTDEGDYGAIELLMAISGQVDDKKDEAESKTPKTEEEKFASKIDLLITFLDDKKIKSTFVGRTYAPFMFEMKNRGYVQTFAYLVLQQSGNKTAEKWLIDNSQKTLEFINWAKTYQPSR
ncbi:MAG TPA: tetratricopeptide repeat protein [Pyrinomonadaceae bacterium]|jgi:tetratricopeptide (TPR) repeat protein